MGAQLCSCTRSQSANVKRALHRIHRYNYKALEFEPTLYCCSQSNVRWHRVDVIIISVKNALIDRFYRISQGHSLHKV